MKAISMRQPWLHAVLNGTKRIENRRWNTHYRGPILLHASKHHDDDYCFDAYDWMKARFSDAPWLDSMPIYIDMPHGVICGRANLVEVVPPTIGGPTVELAGVDMRWHMRDQYGFVLEDVEPLPFEPWPGQLNIFEVPDDYATRSMPPRRIARTS